MIINIRGTSGSGKSSLVRELMNQADEIEEIRPASAGGKLVGYSLEGLADKDVHVVGSYHTACGGCDGIKTQDEVCARVRRFAKMGHVVFEGLLISHIYGRYKALHQELDGLMGQGPYHWLFLDTPLEVCLENVAKRREARGNTAPLNPTNTIQKWHDSRRVFDKAESDGLDPCWIDFATGAEFMTRLLNQEST